MVCVKGGHSGCSLIVYKQPTGSVGQGNFPEKYYNLFSKQLLRQLLEQVNGNNILVLRRRTRALISIQSVIYKLSSITTITFPAIIVRRMLVIKVRKIEKREGNKYESINTLLYFYFQLKLSKIVLIFNLSVLVKTVFHSEHKVIPKYHTIYSSLKFYLTRD